MLFYSLTLKVDKDYSKALQNEYGFEDKDFSKAARIFNQTIGKHYKKDVKVFFVGYDSESWNFLASIESNNLIVNHLILNLQQDVAKYVPGVLNFSVKEITAKEFCEKYAYAVQVEYVIDSPHYEMVRSFCLDYLQNNSFSLEQKVLSSRNLTKQEALDRAEKLMLGKDMLEEIENIYCEKHPQEFMGVPVHYKINCINKVAGYEVVKLLARALQSNKRVLGHRVDYVYGIESYCYDDVGVVQLFQHSAGQIMVLELSYPQDESGFANAYERVVAYFNKLVNKNKANTVFIFLEEVKKLGFSKKLVNSFGDKLSIVELSEGMGNKDAAKNFLKKLIQEKNLLEYTTDSDIDELLTEDCYKASELYTMANKWQEFCLMQKIYTAYSDKTKELKVEKLEEGNSIEELNNLVGLTKVKELTREIIAANVLDKRRSEISKKPCQASKHMIFTGNPGSAKTTVARLIAKVLKENKVLNTGEFVECGRADLVGRYVGWTAKTVRKKFRKAAGGILFIDEAYSLVDSSQSFGEEAINTIVQEMENHRDDTIVIFAGYPKRMKEFMDSNEGLRSRIAFQLDFPDYNAEELMGILDLMLEERGFSLTEAGSTKAMEIFEAAVYVEDFGNGRLVRNILERAIMRQSVRLFNKGSQTLSDKELFILDADDIDDSLLTMKYETIGSKSIGFVA